MNVRSGSGKKRDRGPRVEDGPRKRMPPIVLVRQPPPSSRPHGFTAAELNFIEGMRSRDRNYLHGLLEVKAEERAEPLRVRVLLSQLPLETRLEVFRRLETCENEKYIAWVQKALSLPLGVHSKRPTGGFRQHISKAERCMDQHITGHASVKLEVLRHINSWLVSGQPSGFAIGLEGAPGIGKTTFVKKALSPALGKPCAFVSLGGASNSTLLLGHSYTYEGATSGRIVDILVNARVMDPIIFFDELDKVSATPRGEEVINTLLHLTDPAQNGHIRDNYLHGIDLDLSRAVFIFSYNDASKISPVLLDRIRRVRMEAPSAEERMDIVKKHMLPTALSRHRLELTVPDEVLRTIVSENSEGGMRTIEKTVDALASSLGLMQTCGTTRVLGLEESEDGEALASPALMTRVVRSVLVQAKGTERCHSSLMYS